MDKDRDMNNMDIEGEERNDPLENSVQVSPTPEASSENSEGNEVMAVEPNTPDLQQNNIIGNGVSFSLLLWTKTHQESPE